MRTKRPGPPKKIRPQRDAQGRFAPKAGRDVPKPGFHPLVSVDDLCGQPANWLKRFRIWLGLGFIGLGMRVYGLRVR